MRMKNRLNLVIILILGFIVIGLAQDTIVIDIGGGDIEVVCENTCEVEFYPNDGFATVIDSQGGYVVTAPFYGNTTGGSGMTNYGSGSVGCGLFEVCRPIVGPENKDV